MTSLLGNITSSLITLGRLDRSIAAGERGVALARAERDQINLGTALLNLSAAHCLRGDYEKAVRFADQVLALSRATGDRIRTCEELIIRSQANLGQGETDAAYLDVENAYAIALASGYGYAVAVVEKQRSKVFAAQGRLSEAAQTNARAEAAFSELTRVYRDPVIEKVVA